MGLGFKQSGKIIHRRTEKMNPSRNNIYEFFYKIEQNAQISRRRGANREKGGENENKLKAGKDTENQDNTRKAKD